MSPEESSSSQPNKAKIQNDDVSFSYSPHGMIHPLLMRAQQKTNTTNKQVVILQSKLEELEANIRTLKNDKKVMAEDKVALTRDKNNLALALKAIEDKKIGLRRPLSHEREAYNGVCTHLTYIMSRNRLLIPHTAPKRFSRTDRWLSKLPDRSPESWRQEVAGHGR